MTLLLEKTPVELYEAELAATPVPESPADLLPATATQAPPVAATDLAGMSVAVKRLDRDGNPTGSWLEIQTAGPVTVAVAQDPPKYAPGGPVSPSWFIDLSLTTVDGLWKAATHIPECVCGCGTMLDDACDPTPQEIAACLVGAADRIDRAGWTQNALFIGERSCAQGAITYQAAGGTQPHWPLAGYAAKLFGRANFALATWLTHNAADWYEAASVPKWNDMSHRTQADVTSALRNAADAVLAGTFRR